MQELISEECFERVLLSPGVCPRPGHVFHPLRRSAAAYPCMPAGAARNTAVLSGPTIQPKVQHHQQTAAFRRSSSVSPGVAAFTQVWFVLTGICLHGSQEGFGDALRQQLAPAAQLEAIFSDFIQNELRPW